jgi:hypothetical protein
VNQLVESGKEVVARMGNTNIPGHLMHAPTTVHPFSKTSIATQTTSSSSSNRINYPTSSNQSTRGFTTTSNQYIPEELPKGYWYTRSYERPLYTSNQEEEEESMSAHNTPLIDHHNSHDYSAHDTLMEESLYDDAIEGLQTINTSSEATEQFDSFMDYEATDSVYLVGQKRPSDSSLDSPKAKTQTSSSSSLFERLRLFDAGLVKEFDSTGKRFL